MKILQKRQDIDRLKTQERQQIISEGVALAAKIDMLRQTSLTEEKKLFEWRENNINKVRGEISQLIAEKDTIILEISDARTLRDKLLIPLDKEWGNLNEEKRRLGIIYDDLLVRTDEIKEQEENLNKKEDGLSKRIVKLEKDEREINKSKQETENLGRMARREYARATSDREANQKESERKIKELDERKKEYEVALTTIEVREQEVKEKEVDIIKREQHLESQQRILQIAKKVLKK